jgi:hypothetical protein
VCDTFQALGVDVSDGGPALLIRAAAWTLPAEMACTPVRPLTATGVISVVVVPLPSWPRALSPQPRTVPPVSSARPNRPPAATADDGPTPGMSIGTSLLEMPPGETVRLG